MPRRSTGKRLRFEVFKRDLFTCRYCGAQPPEVLLVVDHLVPVVDGGASTLDNLITACEPCNQGKGARTLGQVAPPTDADLLYLSVQQEVVEMRRYQAAIRERGQAINELVDTLIDRWLTVTANRWEPPTEQVQALLAKYDIESVGRAMEDVSNKLAGGYLTPHANWIGYLWKVARTLDEEELDAGHAPACPRPRSPEEVLDSGTQPGR
jgi:hypothetical protein